MASTPNSQDYSRRGFLRTVGLGLAGGFAAMFLGQRLSARKKQGPEVRYPEDSMFRPRDQARPQS